MALIRIRHPASSVWPDVEFDAGIVYEHADTECTIDQVWQRLTRHGPGQGWKVVFQTIAFGGHPAGERVVDAKHGRGAVDSNREGRCTVNDVGGFEHYHFYFECYRCL